MHKYFKRYFSLLLCLFFLAINFYFATIKNHLLIEISLILSALVVVAYLVIVKNIHKEYILKISSVIEIGIQYHEPDLFSRKNLLFQFMILICVYSIFCYFAKTHLDTDDYNFIMIQAISGLFIFFLMLDYNIFKLRVNNVNRYLLKHSKM